MKLARRKLRKYAEKPKGSIDLKVEEEPEPDEVFSHIC
jgi:hypothetical protein